MIERGIQENVLELALRGQPRSPFYMVGRMGEQSVVIRAEKGQVKMLVDGEEPRPHQEVIYDLEGGAHDHRNQSQEGTAACTLRSSESRRCCRSGPSGGARRKSARSWRSARRCLSHWEKRALAAMLQALESQTRREPGPALSPKLERLVARQAVRQQGRLAKLEKRLAKLQDPKAPPPPK